MTHNENKEELPLVVDTVNGDELYTSSVELENHDNPVTFKRPHLLSPYHRKRKIELPY